MPKNITDKPPKLITEIISQIKKQGFAQFDFGTFRIYERKHGKIVYIGADKPTKVKKYKALFFRCSNTLKRAVKKIK